jgi:hypothetical protein
MAETSQSVLFGAIVKLARAGEQVGFTVEEMIELLKTGVSVETLLDLIGCRLNPTLPHISSINLNIAVAGAQTSMGG